MIPPDRTTADRVVVRAPNWLGDAVMALPAMAAVRRHFASAELTVAAGSGVARLFAERTGVAPDRILEVPTGDRAAVRQLRDGRFDVGVLFPNSFATAWVMRRAGVTHRWGYGRSARGWLLTRRAARHADAGRGLAHQSDYYRQLVRGLGIPCEEDAPRIDVTPAAVARSMRLAGLKSSHDARLVLLAPGAAYGQAKQWSPDRVAALIGRLVGERGATCVLVGAAHDRDAGIRIESWLRDHAPAASAGLRNLIGRTQLADLIALAAGSRVCVTNDSGAMHVAAATGVPVVALFGPTDERVTRPLGRGDVLTAPVFCRPCHLRDCPIDHRCMKRITVDTVFAAVSRQLAFARSPA